MAEPVEIFLIDPPWPKKKGGKRKVRPNQGRELDYKTASVEEIFALLDAEIFTRAKEQHSVFLWTIDDFLIDAEKEMLSRGYKRHARFVWDKGNGVAPCFTIRYAHEYLIWYYKPKLMKVAKEQRGKFTTIIREPARQHSRKPDAAFKMLEAMFPESVKLDVFSREQRNGWLQFGDQIQHFDDGLKNENRMV